MLYDFFCLTVMLIILLIYPFHLTIGFSFFSLKSIHSIFSLTYVTSQIIILPLLLKLFLKALLIDVLYKRCDKPCARVVSELWLCEDFKLFRFAMAVALQGWVCVLFASKYFAVLPLLQVHERMVLLARKRKKCSSIC